ncbi:MAG TPA: DNA repair protein RadC [Paenalcaligenes sp.]|nr:DNA repair protein RadC [Paenalcaligenes sp.]
MKSQRKTFSTLKPRERLLSYGARVLSDAELLAVLLRTGNGQQGVVKFAQHLLEHFGGLRQLLHAAPQQLMAQPGIGNAKACEILAVSELSRRSIEQELKETPGFTQTRVVKRYCIAHLGHLAVEHCIAIFLNTQLQLITTKVLAKGTLNQAHVYPREVVKAALKHHAAAVILAHNHPSGAREASAADIALTQHLIKALALVDIRLVDHVIVAANHATSMAEEGLLL